jgi:hypothetical protein
MSALDSTYAALLVGIALYIWRRDPPRLLLTPLTLISFFVLYGIGHFIYYANTDAVPRVHNLVTLNLLIMWIALLLGFELARATSPSTNRRANSVVSRWRITALHDSPTNNQLLAILGTAMAISILFVFLALGKLHQIASFLAIDSTIEKQKYRGELAGQGGYLYQTLIASIAPFLSFLLILKGMVARQRHLLAAGILLCIAVFAGKLGTFHKVPWLVYIIQIVIIFQANRRLELGLGRILGFSILVLVGGVLAATIALPELDAVGIFQWLAYRFFEVNNEVVYQTFYVYPDHIPHTWGMNIGLIHTLFGHGELISAHSRVANFFGADGATFDAFFIGDAWVDFSYPGVFFMALIVGYFIKSIDIVVMSIGKTPLALALLGSSIYGLFQIQVTSAFTAFLSGGLLFIPLVAVLAIALANDLTRATRRAPTVRTVDA